MIVIPPYFDHQLQTLEFLGHTPRAFDMSDPGTAKTRGHLGDFVTRRQRGGRKGLVFAPRSILQLAWGDDIDKFFPGVGYQCAYATNRERAFRSEADLYITNHDAVKWLLDKKCPLPKNYFDQFDTLYIDESSAFKHHTAARSSCMAKLAERFEFIHNLSGTPNSNTILDVWHQVFLLDRGQRLGNSFWKFRNQVCTPKQVGPGANHVKWVDKEGIEAVVMDMIADITIRHRLEDCIDIPPNHQWNREFVLSPKVRKAYEQMLADAVAELDNGRVVTSVHASSLNQKLLQIASGAVYESPNVYVEIDDTRAEMIMDMVEERPHSIVVFMWHHQRDQLMRIAQKRGITHFLIDGSVSSDKKRTEGVREFQAGNLQVGFVHPQSAGHGLTLTKGTATIMASPTHNAEHYKQVFHRIYRASQTHKTETIHVRARDCIDNEVYDGSLGPKLDSMSLFLTLAQQYKDRHGN